MNLKKPDAFKSEAVQLALTSGLARKQVAADLAIGFPTLNKKNSLVFAGKTAS